MKYRMLKEGEKIRKGDQVLRLHPRRWILSQGDGYYVTRLDVGYYRRPIKSKPKPKIVKVKGWIGKESVGAYYSGDNTAILIWSSERLWAQLPVEVTIKYKEKA